MPDSAKAPSRWAREAEFSGSRMWRMPHEVGGIDARAGGEGVVGADREHPGQFHDRALFDAADRSADGDPGEVEVVGGECVEAAAAGVLGLELQAHPGVEAAEGDDGVGHEVPHGRRAGGDAH